MLLLEIDYFQKYGKWQNIKRISNEKNKNFFDFTMKKKIEHTQNSQMDLEKNLSYWVTRF